MGVRSLIHGVGVNDADYPVVRHENVDNKRKRVWMCPYYSRWATMLKRCYSQKHHSAQPTYTDCLVCNDWLVFSEFKRWMEKQDWQDRALDKDLLIPNNRLYSPRTCVFVDVKINNFLLDSRATRGKYMIGCFLHKSSGKFRAMCRNPFTDKHEHLGLFTNELQAHLAWKTRKHELACMLAESEYVDDPRVAEALRTRYL